jgi:Zn-dependent protease/predicted transcriptional regulator
MFGKRIPLFKLFGFTVNVDLSWLILAVLVTWSLAKGLFPYYFAGLSNQTYWWMGVAGAGGLFMSIIFHEFCHSIVARQFGLPMKSITLFIFGGVAEMESEPESPKAEFLMAIMGPVSSMLLGATFFLVLVAGKSVGWSKPVNGVLQYLMVINFVLAGFNLLPAFPLDGGRVLRSILWGVKGNLRWATRIASGLGSAIGIFLIVFGVLNFISGNYIGGIWYFLIGMFIRTASQTSYSQLLLRKALAGEEILHFMKTEPISVPPSLSVEQLVNDYFYKYHYKMFPVSDGDGLIGCVGSRQVKELPRDQWSRHAVRDVMAPCSDANTISPRTDALQALSLMNRTGNGRLMVVDENRLLGIVTLKDMLKFLALKIDLEADPKQDS